MTEVSYFQNLNLALRAHDRAIPSLVIDLDILDRNIAKLKQSLNPNTAFRIVVKSLPSKELIQYIMERTGTAKLMVFHQPFLTDLSSICDEQTDILMGKPMPVKTAAYYYHTLPTLTNGYNPYRQVQWLVDTLQRVKDYTDLAKRLQQKLRLNLEIDIGLHRGGFADLDAVREALVYISAHQEHIEFSGFMGYDPHVVKIPSVVQSQTKSLQIAHSYYDACQKLVQEEFSSLWHEGLCYNGAGSPTLDLHKSQTPLNDISAGSCLLKPTSFDIPTLSQYEAACFIAAPILKKYQNTSISGLEKLKSVMSLIKPAFRQSFFLYGGYWKADYCYPEGLKSNPLFGESTNQTMVNAPKAVELDVDDFVFLRPRQSEFVLLQFGNILTYRAAQLSGEFSVLQHQ